MSLNFWFSAWEYFMINTYDVHFYSSWAILKNWPQIEMSMQLDFGEFFLIIWGPTIEIIDSEIWKKLRGLAAKQ